MQVDPVSCCIDRLAVLFSVLLEILPFGFDGVVAQPNLFANVLLTIQAPGGIGGVDAVERLLDALEPVSYTHLTLPTIYSV